MNLNPEASMLNVMKRLNLNTTPQDKIRGQSGNHVFKLAHNHYPPRVPYAMYCENMKNIHPWSTRKTEECKDCSGNPPVTGCKTCCHDPCHWTDAIGCIMGLQGEQCFNFNRVQKRREDPEYDYYTPSMQYWACPGCDFTRPLTEPFDGNCNCPAKVFDENWIDPCREHDGE